jgi:iron-sulfur cluster repair protein YtfE (RIC family)
MKLTDALLGEHGAFYILFDQIETIAASESAMAQSRGATTVLEAMVGSHATLEDELLFSALEPHLGKAQGPLAVMRAEHAELERILAHIQDEPDENRAILWIPEALRIARDHFHKEEQVLFPMAERILGDDILNQLGAKWAKARCVNVD